VSNNDWPDRAPLYTYAIACVLLDEIDAKGLKVSKVQELSGIKARSWSDYMGGKTRGVPLEKWAAIAGALGLKTSDVMRRAEERLDALDATDAALLLSLSGPAAMMVMREKRPDARGGGLTSDPPDRARERMRRSA
jgi:hypothetical protein